MSHTYPGAPPGVQNMTLGLWILDLDYTFTYKSNMSLSSIFIRIYFVAKDLLSCEDGWCIGGSRRQWRLGDILADLLSYLDLAASSSSTSSSSSSSPSQWHLGDILADLLSYLKPAQERMRSAAANSSNIRRWLGGITLTQKVFSWSAKPKKDTKPK